MKEKKNMVTLKNYLVSVQELSYYIVTAAPIKHAELFRDEGKHGANCCYYLMGNTGKNSGSIKRLKTVCMILMLLSLIVIKHVVCLITVKLGLIISH